LLWKVDIALRLATNTFSDLATKVATDVKVFDLKNMDVTDNRFSSIIDQIEQNSSRWPESDPRSTFRWMRRPRTPRSRVIASGPASAS
jgi:hypothetical protein